MKKRKIKKKRKESGEALPGRANHDGRSRPSQPPRRDHEGIRSNRPATTLTSPWCRLGTCKCLPLAFAELRRVNTNQHLSAGWGYGCREDASTHQPQATREYFKNHPTHDCEIDPTIGGHIGRGIGHPWGALGLLCRKATRRYTKEKGFVTTTASDRT
jgi:hypothetical protein